MNANTTTAATPRTPALDRSVASRGLAALGRFSSFKMAGAAVLLGAVALAGCQSTGGDKTTEMLVGAGFNIKLADTPDKKAALASLPVRKVTMRKVKGKLVFLYADPAGCNCLYVGNESNYQTYQGMAFDRSVASQELLAAQMQNEANWDYGVWGPGWWM